MYAIVHDPASGDWWVQGDEGRVNDPPFDGIGSALRSIFALAQDGHAVDMKRYYIHDPNHGPDWDNPQPITATSP